MFLPLTLTIPPPLSLNIPHSRNASDLSETIDEPESVVSFNENAYLASQNADISTVTYAEEARTIIEQLATKQDR